MRHPIRIAFVLAFVSAVAVVAACGSASSPSSPNPPTVPVDPSVLPSMSLMLADKTLGSADAPHTIVEYQSFACPHCADFHSMTFPQLKSQYIDTGIVKLVVRDFPFRSDGLDVTAAMLARCAGDRYFDAGDALYASQSTWASGGTTALENVMRQFGMSQQVIDACKASTTLRDGILKMKQDGANQWQINGVPTFVLDGGARIAIGFQYISVFASWLS